MLGGLALGAAAGALKNRRKVADLLGGGTNAPEPYQAPAAAAVGAPAVQRDEPAPAPAIANVDAAGPPANTATHVPAPEPQIHEPAGGIDEAMEEAAAAAEAANIGGIQPLYASEEDFGRPAAEATRPLEEAGEGYSEGQELAEADLIENAEPAAGDPIEGGRHIDDVIEAQDDLFAGEAIEGSPMGETEPVPEEAPGRSESLPIAGPPPPSPRAPESPRPSGLLPFAPPPPAPAAPESAEPLPVTDPPSPPESIRSLSITDAPPSRESARPLPITDAPGSSERTRPLPIFASPAEPRTEGTLATGTAQEGTPTTGGSPSGQVTPSEMAAERQSSALWRTDAVEDRPTGEQPAADDPPPPPPPPPRESV